MSKSPTCETCGRETTILCSCDLVKQNVCRCDPDSREYHIASYGPAPMPKFPSWLMGVILIVLGLVVGAQAVIALTDQIDPPGAAQERMFQQAQDRQATR